MRREEECFMFIDNILCAMYLEYDIPCDRLVSDPERLSQFTEDYERRTGQDAAAKDVGHQLLNLRRRGEANGGLPRLRRRYNGRGPSQNQQPVRLNSDKHVSVSR